MQYQLCLPEFCNGHDYNDHQLDGDAMALKHIPGTPFDNTIRVYKPTHIESIMRNIIGPSFDKMIARQEVINAE